MSAAADFQAAMAAAGIDYHGAIIADGQLHRVKANGDSGPNGWYVLHLDGIAAGIFGCWKRGIRETWCAKSDTELTTAERAERDRRWKQQQAERDAIARRMHDQAARVAESVISAAQPATDDHPYLKLKGIKAHPGVRVGHWPQRKADNCLLIPLRTAVGKLTTVQAIFPEKPTKGSGRDKDLLKDGAKKGAYFGIGDLDASETILVAEGYATAETLHEVTGHAAVMAMDAGNLKPVAQAIRALYPDKTIIICADNDRKTKGNPGITQATDAAQAINARLAVPEFAEGEDDKTDFNDLAAIDQEHVLKAIAEASEPPRVEPEADMPPPDDLGYLDSLGAKEPPKTEGQGIQPPPWKSLDLDAMAAARLHPRCIVEYQLYADLAVMNAEGGTGKTTLLLYEAIHIALRRDLWGCRVLNPGRTLFITAEDGEELLQARLREVMTALNLTDYERRKVCENVMFWDVTGSLVRLAELDARGNLQLTALADRIVETYRDAGLVQVIFDPAISFSPGERIVNDGEQAIVTACRRIIRGLNCCVRLIHHSGQSNARNGAIDQYAGRGGTALPDGARMVTILASANRVNLARPEGFDLQPGESGFVMARAKLSYAPPQPNIWIRRRGWTFDYFVEEPRNSDAVRDHDADKVAEFLTEEFHHGRRCTARSLEDSGRLKLPRARLRAALATLETAGRLDERELPTDQRRGRKKHYLHCAKDSGAIAAETPPEQPTPSPIAPDISIAPPYRETRNGAIDAVLVSPDSLHCAKDSGAIAAQWRNSDEPADAEAMEAKGRRLLEESKTAPSGTHTLPTGEIVADSVPAPGSRQDLRNRGNRLLEQVRVMRLAQAGKQESPSPADPHAARVAELIAQGWAPWNARARAEAETNRPKVSP